jgi:hypothetical protein
MPGSIPQSVCMVVPYAASPGEEALSGEALRAVM